MDPLTITATVITLSATCVKSSRQLYDLKEKYKDASMIITAIYSESNVISSSLAHIQGLCTQNPEVLQSTLRERPELEKTFDQALTGCVLVYSVLDDEVQRLYTTIAKDGMAGAIGRMKMIWREETMKDVLTQIRGQQTALTLLIQALQMSSIHEIKILLQNNFGAIQASNQRLTRFRQSNPRVKAPSSVFESAIDDVASLYSVDSTASSTDFSFDDLVINSQAYRRALNQTQSNLSLGPLKEKSETSSDTETVIESSIADESRRYIIPQQVRSRLTINQLHVLFNCIDDIVGVKCKEESITISGQLAQMTKDFEDLRQKYLKIKRYYFDMMQQKEQQAKECEMLAAENNRIMAEKAEIEQGKDFLSEKVLGLDKFFGENEARRKLLVESHEKELELKNKEKGELQVRYTTEQKTSIELRSKLIEKESEVRQATIQLENKINQLLKVENRVTSLYEDLQNTEKVKVAIEEELQRYKGFDTIIEQLRQLSPGPPTSPGATSRPINNPQPAASATPAPIDQTT